MDEQTIQQTNQESTISPVTTPPKKYSNSIIGILLLLLGIMIGLVIDKTTILSNFRISYLGAKPTPATSPSPTPNITADWKTYTSVDNSFTFKFPSDWQVQPNQTFGSRSVTELRFKNNPLLEVALIGNYNQITGKPYKNLEEYLSLRQQLSKDILLHGRQAKHIVDAGDPGHVTPYEEIVTFSSDKKSVIRLYFNPDFYPGVNEDKVFDQILSTFKFLDQPTTTPTAKYSCPASGWVDCMPGPDSKPECSTEAMTWYKANCPNFKGGAL